MPTYVYECRSCTKTFEVEQRISEAPLTDCDCGAEGSVRRLIQPIAVMFKGSGFHVNDYQPKSAEPAAEPASCTGTPSACPACASPALETPIDP